MQQQNLCFELFQRHSWSFYDSRKHARTFLALQQYSLGPRGNCRFGQEETRFCDAPHSWSTGRVTIGNQREMPASERLAPSSRAGVRARGSDPDYSIHSAAAKGLFGEFLDGLVEWHKLLLFGSESANGDCLIVDFALANGE